MKLILQMEIAPDDEEEKVNLPKHPLTYTSISLTYWFIDNSQKPQMGYAVKFGSYTYLPVGS